MKKLLLVVFVALTVSATAQQRERGGMGGMQNMTPEERAKAMTDRLAELVTLTADQKEKISVIELDLANELETKRRNAQGDPQLMRTAMQEIERLREERYRPVLTVEQLNKYIEDRERRQRERGGGQGERGGGQGGPRPRN